MAAKNGPGPFLAAVNGPPGPIMAAINGPPSDNWFRADYSWQPKMVPEKLFNWSSTPYNKINKNK